MTSRLAIYLTHAIRSLAHDYPYLAAVAPDGKIRLNIRLYKYRKSSTARILGLREGGSAPLLKFVKTYRTETAKFKGPGLKRPFVILYDNDSGASDIKQFVKGITGNTSNGTDPFVHAFGNVYAVATPLPKGAQSSKIEDFFDPSLLLTILGGKAFNPDENTFDTNIHYGKKIFAEAVVRPHAATINFNGFRPLLTNLAAAIKGA